MSNRFVGIIFLVVCLVGTFRRFKCIPEAPHHDCVRRCGLAGVWRAGLDELRELRYRSETRAPRKPREQTFQMRRSLLSDGFQLKLHKETREPFATWRRLEKHTGSMKNRSGDSPRVEKGENGKIVFHSFTMAQLAHYLSLRLRRDVTDKTMLAGGYDFEFFFTPETPSSSYITATGPAGDSSRPPSLSGRNPGPARIAASNAEGIVGRTHNRFSRAAIRELIICLESWPAMEALAKVAFKCCQNLRRGCSAKRPLGSSARIC